MKIRKLQRLIVGAFTLLPLALGLAGGSAFGVTVEVLEGTSTSATIYTAADRGAGITYSLVGPDASAFTINNSGTLKIISVPDYETKASYSFTIDAFQSGVLHSVESMVVNITDLPPVISSGSASSISEGISAGTPVYTATAADPAGGVVTYSLTGTDATAFSINSSTGVVTINAVPDFETKSSYSITVKASDPLTIFSTKAVTINVTDLPPVISSGSTASIPEGISAGATVYTVVGSDPGGGTVTYSMAGSDASAFSINSSTGVVTINAVPDFETKSSYNITVKASDPSALNSTKAVTINVTDLPPVISSGSTASIPEGISAGTPVYTATAADPAGGVVTYNLTGTDASAFSINSATGVVTINAKPVYRTKSAYNFNIKASDASGLFNTQAVTVTVQPVIANTPSLLTGSFVLSNGVFEFSFTNLAAANFTVLTSTNLSLPLSNWTVLGVITDSPPGQYHFGEPLATNSQQRFYRVRSP